MVCFERSVMSRSVLNGHRLKQLRECSTFMVFQCWSGRWYKRHIANVSIPPVKIFR